LEEYEQSEAIARKIIDKKPSQPKPYLTLANCLKKADKKTDADKVFNEVLHLFPDSTEILLSYATACQEWGEFSKAENNARAALEKGDCLAEACNILSTVCKFNSIDPVFEKLESSLEENQWPLKNIMHGHFALGNMYANLNKYDQAFTHYSHANKHRHVFFGEEYDEEKDIRKFVTAQKLFTSDYFANRNNFANPTNKPIFIVGMPRSGSTLIEQILGSHSNVFAAGELPYLKQYLYSCNNMTNDVMVMDVGNNFPKFLAHDISKKYLNKITQINNYRPRITDKMPSNFELLWLIALIFPNSTIIHSKRNPVDTCLSCYFQDFIKPHPYKNTLSGLGKYFRYYRNLMDHWEKVLPVTIHDISYEEVVADPENQVKKLLSACDLEFEQGCLDFHKTERSVKTASAYQVRQKIYTSSVQKWRKYEKHLGPLLEALGDYKEWGK
jgi:tetratricopeptide (TPR) repeat protein